VGALPYALVFAAALGALMLLYRLVRPRDAWQRGSAVFLLLALVCYPIPGAISLPGPAAPRVIHGLPIIVLIAVFGLLELATIALQSIDRVSRRMRIAVIAVAGAALAVLFLGQSVRHMDAYFSNYGAETGFDFHYGFNAALAFAVRNQQLYDEIWVAHVNEPYIYLLFDQQIDPEEARQTMVMIRDPGAYNWVSQYENFYFTSRIWVDPPADIPLQDLPVAFQTFHPNGEIAYEVRAGEVPGRGLVMVIYRPQWL
jgi:hypothetical protein